MTFATYNRETKIMDYSRFDGEFFNEHMCEDESYEDGGSFDSIVGIKTKETDSEWLNNFKSFLCNSLFRNDNEPYDIVLNHAKNFNVDNIECNYPNNERIIKWLNAIKVSNDESGELLKYVTKYKTGITTINCEWLYRQLTYYMCGRMEAYKVELFKEICILNKTEKYTKEENSIYDEVFTKIEYQDKSYEYTKYIIDNYYYHRENNKFDLTDYIQECLCILLEAENRDKHFKNGKEAFEYAYPKLFETLYSNNLVSSVSWSHSKGGRHIKALREFESIDNIKYDQNFILTEKEAFAGFNQSIIKEFIMNNIHILTEIEKYVFLKRAALENELETGSQLSKKVGVSKNRVHQIENKAKRKLYRKMKVSVIQENNAMFD